MGVRTRRLGPADPTRGYVAAVLATAAVVLLRWSMNPWLHDGPPFVTLFAAVAAPTGFDGAAP